MLHTKDIIRQIWEAQGYGNLAVWDDGTTRVVDPSQTPLREGQPPLAIFKPLPLVGGFPTLDHAQYNGELQDEIEERIRNSGGKVSRD